MSYSDSSNGINQRESYVLRYKCKCKKYSIDLWPQCTNNLLNCKKKRMQLKLLLKCPAPQAAGSAPSATLRGDVGIDRGRHYRSIVQMHGQLCKLSAAKTAIGKMEFHTGPIQRAHRSNRILQSALVA